ncbi:sulfurtransferase complex subunit TusB [Pseudomonas sp. v388]|uniref:sulfurtransferase complex subunit TusB n=1 Tax=Pseudomonas sp. v388 TaxID=2479849 RepID=UPI000F77B8BE|nr:sulfurtransferase complex subunit TusB [Pseudomonas sp. v388]RRV04414.1 sulfurtransferase complex subunit TusB [Pseudomonas sp. v388]
MATLHVLSHSPFADTRLASCLSLLGPQDGLLLCGDAVYALACANKRLDCEKLFALAEDLTARNLAAPEGVEAIDYAGFVELSIRFDRVNTWL